MKNSQIRQLFNQARKIASRFAERCDFAAAKEIKAFPRAFLVRNDLLMPYNPDAPEPTAEQKEQFAIAEDLATGIKKSLLSKQLEMKD